MSRVLAQVAGIFVAPGVRTETEVDEPVARGDAPAPFAAGSDAATAGTRRDAPVLEWQAPAAGNWSSAPAAAASDSDRRLAADQESMLVPRPPRSAAVLGAGADAITFGAALAGELRARSRARTSLLIVWDPAGMPPTPTPAWPAARALATELAEGHEVAARGRLVQLRLPGEVRAAAAAAGHLSAYTRVPTVLVLSGPRAEAFDHLLSSRELLIVLDAAGACDSLAQLAAAQLRRLNACVEVHRPLTGIGRRVLASCGMSRARSLGARLEPAHP